MSHQAQMDFVAGVKQRFPTSFHRTRVLEVGSYIVNGSVRPFFTDPIVYIGIDLAPGEGVDIICRGHEYDPDERFNTVISTECFEHDPDWTSTFWNMHRLCYTQGLIIVTCAAANRFEHGTLRTSPADSALANNYYKNLNVIDFEQAWPLRMWFSDYVFEARENDLYFYGVKR